MITPLFALIPLHCLTTVDSTPGMAEGDQVPLCFSTYNPFHPPHSKVCSLDAFSLQLPIRSLNNPHQPPIDPVLFQDMEGIFNSFTSCPLTCLAPSPSPKRMSNI